MMSLEASMGAPPTMTWAKEEAAVMDIMTARPMEASLCFVCM
jgi:hypothetical protein